jgi:hypothetical protein
VKHYVRHLHPVQAAKVMAVVYGIIGLIFIPLFFVFSAFLPTEERMGVVFLLVLPVIYAIIGFIGTLIAAAVYNFAAGWVGGFAVDLEPGESTT